MSEVHNSGSAFNVAVVGIAVRLPGAENSQEYWHNLRGGIESIQALTDEQLLAAGVDPVLIANPNYVRSSAALQDIDLWDAPFFGFNPKEAAIMDPQHRLFLECAWEALEDAAHPPEMFPGSIAVFAGCGMQSYFTRNLAPNRELIEKQGMFLVRHTGNDKDFLATRVSYCFNLRGPSMNIQTACSTSLVAIHVAAQSLIAGECDMALAGGVSIELPHGTGYLFKEGEVASPDGHCRAFDAAGQGTLFGSGAGVVVLRRLEDAIADGDNVYAVIRGSAVNNDGSAKVGYLAPSVEGQSRAAAEALAVAGIEPDTVSYMEAHGTGTPVGDPIELAALTQAYGIETSPDTAWCAIGSVKTNFGHLDTAAGVASFVKAALSLSNEAIPPSLHFSQPNPSINFADSPFFVNTLFKPWPRSNQPRRAAVNSLGVGGTNAHVILEEAPTRKRIATVRDRHLFVISARSELALNAAAENIAQHLLDNPSLEPGQVAFTLREGRHAFAERRAFIARSRDEAVALLSARDRNARIASARAGDTPMSVAFMFAGGGAQRPGMARDLYHSEKAFRFAVDNALLLLNSEARGSVTQFLLATEADQHSADAERPSIALPALFITQYALTELFGSWGVVPSAMIGHSLGEYVAAHLAGVFSLAEVLQLVTLRGNLFEAVDRGGMLSVQVSAERLRSLIPETLSIAAVNAPELSVASGPMSAITKLEAILLAEDISFSRIRIDVAAHSQMLEPILGTFRAFLQTLKMSPPRIPFVSNFSGDWIQAKDAVDAEYWVKHLRNTVLFADGVGRLLEDSRFVLLEVGPGRTLATLAREHPDAAGRAVLTSMRAHDEESTDDASAAMFALGGLWTNGVAFDWSKFRGGEAPDRVALPTYPFERQRHWIDAPAITSAGAGSDKPQPGSRAPVKEWFYVPDWVQLRAPATTVVATGTEGVAIVLDDDSPMGEAISESLRARFARVVTVRKGSTFAARARDAFEIDTNSASDFERLLTQVSSEGKEIAHILHLWTLDNPRAQEDSRETATVNSFEERAFYSLAHLAQGLGRWSSGRQTRLTVLSNNMFTVAADEAAAPWKSLALGPSRVIPAEYPEMTIRTIDLAIRELRSGSIATLRDQFIAELFAEDRPAEVALRRGASWTWRYHQMPLEAVTGLQAPLRDRGIYLVTGGLGGIGSSVAEELARRCRARLVIASRSAPDADQGPVLSPEAQRLVSRCEGWGAQLHFVRANVSVPEGAAHAVAETIAHYGGINGVFHAAGTLNDGLLQLRTDAEAAAVLAAKVRGTIALDAALAKQQLDCFVLFSSISAIAGLPGQADYAAANAFMDAFAVERRARTGDSTVSIGWSAWRDIGMTGGEATLGVPEHPCLQRVLYNSKEAALFESSLSTERDWLISEHRLRDGTALIPGTGYLEIAAAAQTAGTSAPSAIELTDVAFLAPMVYQNGVERTFRVSLQRNGGRSSFTIAAEESGSWYQVATGKSGWTDDAPRSVDSLDAVRIRCTQPARTRFTIVDHPHLALGPRWNCVTEVRYGNGEALGSLSLPNEQQRDADRLRLHPALLDMATACALELVPHYDLRRDFYVPLGYTRLVSYAPLTNDLFSHIRVAESDLDPNEVAVFDVVLYSPDGRVLVDIHDFMMTRVTSVESMLASNQRKKPFKAASAARTGARPDPFHADAITVPEGLDAMIRVVSSGTPANVAVSWCGIDEMLRKLHARLPGEPEVSPADTVRVLPLPNLEGILTAHPVVENCAAVQRKDRTGADRTVCYVVFRTAMNATVSDLRRFVKSKLSGSQRAPSNFVTLDALPRRSDGTVDYEGLPDPFGVADTFVAPRTDTESAIAEAWVEALGVARVSIHDNFFDIGGHSLLAVRVVTKLDRKLGVRLSQAIMVLQTLGQIAAECDRQRALGGSSAAAAAS